MNDNDTFNRIKSIYLETDLNPIKPLQNKHKTTKKKSKSITPVYGAKFEHYVVDHNIDKVNIEKLAVKIKQEQALRADVYNQDATELLNQFKHETDNNQVERALHKSALKRWMKESESKFHTSQDDSLIDTEIDFSAIKRDFADIDYDNNLVSSIDQIGNEAEDSSPTAPVDDSATADGKSASTSDVELEQPVMTPNEYDNILIKLNQQQKQREEHIEAQYRSHLLSLHRRCATAIQKLVRGHLGRLAYQVLVDEKNRAILEQACAVKIQACLRGMICRHNYDRIRGPLTLTQVRRERAAVVLQRFYHEYKRRAHTRFVRNTKCARAIQRIYRGRLGRLAFAAERSRLQYLLHKHRAALTIQGAWRVKIAWEELHHLRVHKLAAVEVQKVWRGWSLRRTLTRERLWQSTPRGRPRVKLGVTWIKEKEALFNRIKDELHGLKRAEERTSLRITKIHQELKKLSTVLSSTLRAEIVELSHPPVDHRKHNPAHTDEDKHVKHASKFNNRLNGLFGGSRVAYHPSPLYSLPDSSTAPSTSDTRECRVDYTSSDVDSLIAEAEREDVLMQIQDIERHVKQREVDAKFYQISSDIASKRQMLLSLETAMTDMKNTRVRKEYEYKAIQSSIEVLLARQEVEFQFIHSQGIALETVPATTAASVIESALNAQAYEKRALTLFANTEETIKYQYISTTMSHEVEAGKLRRLRDAQVYADLDSATLTDSYLSDGDEASEMGSARKGRKYSLRIPESSVRSQVPFTLDSPLYRAPLTGRNSVSLPYIKPALSSNKASSLPSAMRQWTVDHVCQWLTTLSLAPYASIFREGGVDGCALLELQVTDLLTVLGAAHEQYIQQIISARDRYATNHAIGQTNDNKLPPVYASLTDISSAHATNPAGTTTGTESAVGKKAAVPSVSTVFSQAQGLRYKRVEESLNLGFPLDSRDNKGNTLLMIISQAGHRKLAELLILRGASVNLQNHKGNTALHFAMEQDPEGILGEYLLDHGADDTIVNKYGNTPYQGTTKRVELF